MTDHPTCGPNQVLTDAEIREIWVRPHQTFTPRPFLENARAVEAAVLAKCVKFTDGSYAHFRDGKPVVSEVEARERERRAAVWGNRIYSLSTPFEEQLDARYPSLKPVEPPPLVLSTGRYRKPRGNVLWQHDLTPVSYNTCATPHCETPADARALADWLEKYGT